MKHIRPGFYLLAILVASFTVACDTSTNGAAQANSELHESVPELPIGITDIKPVMHGCTDGTPTDTPGWSFVIEGFGHGMLDIELRPFPGGRYYAKDSVDFRGPATETPIIKALFKGEIVGESYLWIADSNGQPLVDPYEGPAYEWLCR